MATVTGNVPAIAMKATDVQGYKQSKGHGGSRLEDYGEDSYCPNDSGNETLNTERLYIHVHRNEYREDEY